MARAQDVYKEVRVFEFPNMTVRVHIPDLDEKERERRMKILYDAAVAILKEVEYGKQKH